ncbi:MAG TPA: NADPH-dependent ferric siderophore reductase, partial [Massilia sp.]|nr:NADPH-dependent ferric siderophore reductase [Massilia sp.]
RLRTVLAEEKGIAKEAMRVSAYWKQGVADHHENLE